MQGIRRQGRGYALQLLYQVDQTKTQEPEALGRFWLTVDASQKPREFAVSLVAAALEHQARIDKILTGHLEKWKLSRLPVVVRNILRLAVAEMVILKLNPREVVINEAIELTRSFMDEESVKIVNSVLDKCSRAGQGGEAGEGKPRKPKKKPRNG
jgi:N utilization substance protein B